MLGANILINAHANHVTRVIRHSISRIPYAHAIYDYMHVHNIIMQCSLVSYTRGIMCAYVPHPRPEGLQECL